MKTSIHISRHTDDTLRPLLDGRHTLVLTDAHVARHCLPHMTCLQHLPTCIIDAGEKNKSLTSAARIWDFLTTHDATRNSLLVCLGGGMTTDVGGFAASLRLALLLRFLLLLALLLRRVLRTLRGFLAAIGLTVHVPACLSSRKAGRDEQCPHLYGHHRGASQSQR